MFAIAGASLKHNRIVINLILSLATSLRGRNGGDMRLVVFGTGLYKYPDVMVVCGKPILADAEGDVLTNGLKRRITMSSRKVKPHREDAIVVRRCGLRQ